MQLLVENHVVTRMHIIQQNFGLIFFTNTIKSDKYVVEILPYAKYERYCCTCDILREKDTKLPYPLKTPINQ